MTIMSVTRGQAWAGILWAAMGFSGKGYRKGKMQHTGKGQDRRADKLEAAEQGIPKLLRAYKRRYGG